MSGLATIASSFYRTLADARLEPAAPRLEVPAGRRAASAPDRPKSSTSRRSRAISRLSAPAWLQGQTAVALTFAVKTFIASLLALLIAFWAGLDDPRWAFLTVFIVSQPDSGLVLAKSFYRILGTLAGLLVTVALVFAFAQYGELFLAALAIWIFLCNFAAQAERNFASYGFQLAGYTVAIVGLPAALNPSGAYPLVVARGTEIVLGIGCAVLVSRLLVVRELAPKLTASMRSLAARADRLASLVLDPDADREPVLAESAGLVEKYLEVSVMQSSVHFESADGRIEAQRLRPVIDAAMQLCGTAAAVAARRFGDPEPGDGRISRAVPEESGPCAGDAGVAALVDAMVRAEDAREIGWARERLRDAQAAFERGDTTAESTTPCRLWSDPISAALVGLRAVLAIAIVATIWFATAWPHGPAAVVVAAVLCSLLASMPKPHQLTIAAAAAVVTAAVLSFATQFYLLPLATDFPSMALALAPMVLTCSFIMAQPGIGPLGLIAIVYFAFSSNIDNVMTYDAAATLNASVAVLVGIGVALVLFAVFFPETPDWARRRFRRQLVVHLRSLIAARSPVAALRCYELSLYERLGTTIARFKDDPAVIRECMASAGAALCLARSIARLRTCLASGKPTPEISSEARSLLSGLSRSLHRASRTTLVESGMDAHLLARMALELAEVSPEPATLNAVVVASAGVGADLDRARALLEDFDAGRT